jgi:hypothetical protein
MMEDDAIKIETRMKVPNMRDERRDRTMS